MEWMVWTVPTAIFFLCIFAMLGFMTFIDTSNPAAPRKGFLPMATTRGDRLYITVLGCAFINLAWLGLTDWLQYPALVLCLIWGYVLIRWG